MLSPWFADAAAAGSLPCGRNVLSRPLPAIDLGHASRAERQVAASQ